MLDKCYINYFIIFFILYFVFLNFSLLLSNVGIISLFMYYFVLAALVYLEYPCHDAPHISKDWEHEGDPDDPEEEAEQPAPERLHREVTVTCKYTLVSGKYSTPALHLSVVVTFNKEFYIYVYYLKINCFEKKEKNFHWEAGWLLWSRLHPGFQWITIEVVWIKDCASTLMEEVLCSFCGMQNLWIPSSCNSSSST